MIPFLYKNSSVLRIVKSCCLDAVGITESNVCLSNVALHG